MIFIFSGVVDLQCSVNCCCIAKWPGHTHTHIYVLFLALFSIMFHHKWLDPVPGAINPKLPIHPNPSSWPSATTSGPCSILSRNHHTVLDACDYLSKSSSSSSSAFAQSSSSSRSTIIANIWGTKVHNCFIPQDYDSLILSHHHRLTKL